MKCMKCKKNEATFYYKQNINGHVTETALCEECAGDLGQELFADTMSFNPFAGLFELNAPSAVRRAAPDTAKRCTLCGSGFGDLVRSGKIGCAKCYEIFADELAPTIEKLHGRAAHAGRAPGELNAKNERRGREKKLKADLKKAIDAQDFENAAKLRDEIKKLEEDK